MKKAWTNVKNCALVFWKYFPNLYSLQMLNFVFYSSHKRKTFFSPLKVFLALTIQIYWSCVTRHMMHKHLPPLDQANKEACLPRETCIGGRTPWCHHPSTEYSPRWWRRSSHGWVSSCPGLTRQTRPGTERERERESRTNRRNRDEPKCTLNYSWEKLK